MNEEAVCLEFGGNTHCLTGILQALGVTMIAAAVVIPPVVAQLLTNSFNKMLILSVIIGALCGLGGLYVSFYIDVSSGASVVLISALVFIVVLAGTTLKQRISSSRLRKSNHHHSSQELDIH